MFIIFIWLFVCLLNTAYMQIGANACKYMLYRTSLDLALFFYDNIVCKFGMPVRIVNDRDRRFLSNFW